jgi:D-xylose transport system substrate-binding protein
MKRILSTLAGLLAALIAAPSASAADVKVGLSLPTQREERWVKDKQVMEAEAKKAGIDLRVQVTDNDAAKQVAQCENLISQGVKVLILAPHDASSAAVIIDKAAKAGIKVISYDRLVTNSTLDYYYLSFDNVKVGELQGEFITKKQPKGSYIILAGSPTDNNAKLFREGAMKFIKPLADKGDIKIVMDQFVKDWQPSEAQKLCEQALTANQNKVDAVLAPNDGTAGGCIQAMAAQGLAGKVPITGQDAELARVLEGHARAREARRPDGAGAGPGQGHRDPRPGRQQRQEGRAVGAAHALHRHQGQPGRDADQERLPDAGEGLPQVAAPPGGAGPRPRAPPVRP